MSRVTHDKLNVNTPAMQALIPGLQWVCFDQEKKPISPVTLKGVSGALVEGNTDWVSHEAALKVREANSWLKGVGREFIKSQNLTGVDFDECIVDGQIEPWAQAIIARLNSYTELSPSGKGVHIWIYGSIPDNIGADPDGISNVEMYDHERYFTITGKHLEGTPTTIEDRREEILTLHAEVREARQKAKQAKQPKREQAAPGSDSPYGRKALQDECRNVALAREGGRNHQLNISAFALGQLVGGGVLSRSTVERELYDAALAAGLDHSEIAKTLRSGLDAGMAEPRTPPAKEMSRYQAAPGAASNGNGYHPPEDTSDRAFALCSFSADDAGNGDAMAALYGQEFLYCGARGWFNYTGTHWELDPDGAKVRQSAVMTLRQRRHAAVEADNESIIKCTKGDESRVNGCVSRFKTLVYVSIDEFDNHPDLLNCKNGVADLRTGTIEPHSRSQRFTYCLPVEYGPADYSAWVDYLNGVIGGGQEVIDYLQMAIGYSFTGHTREEILFYPFGPTRSGKGTFAETLMALLPSPIAKMVDFNSFTAKREGDVSNFDLAPLKPSRLIFASESNRSQALNPAKIKQLTGGDHITACFKHKDFFSYRPQFKVWMMSNHPVNGDPEDDALWARVRVIEFPNSFLGREDKSKKARLREPDTLKGVLYWIVQGAMKWYALGPAGLITPESVTKITLTQRSELDYVQQWLDECCDDDNEGWTANEVVMASYSEWCKSNNVTYAKGPKALAQSLQAKGYQSGLVKFVGGKTKRGVGGLHVYPTEREMKELAKE